MSLTYTEFIEKVGNNEFVKCLNNELTHFGFLYKIGLNEDHIPFNPSGSCNSGGLYFTTNDNIKDFVSFGLNIGLIELCNAAQFYIDPEGKKFKTNKFIIKEIKQTEDICKLAVQQNGLGLEYVKK